MIEHARFAAESLALTIAASRPVSRPNRPMKVALRAVDGLVRAASRQSIPPTSLLYEGPPFAAHYLFNGWEYEKYLKRFGMKPDSAVLDVGCGVGRKAWAIIRSLSRDGSYHGFDIVPEAVDWCKSQWRESGDRISFKHLDVHNQHYHTKGARTAEQIRFPYNDSSFDLVLSSSVYTHMLPSAVTTYLRESRRVARDGAHLVTSFFVLDETSSSNISRGRSVYTFAHEHGGCRVEHPDCPEHVVAYDREQLEKLLAEEGLSIVTHLPGRWSGRRDGYAYQDLYVLTPTAGAGRRP
ncbi:class I SAM-dependent methyltransferase [Saccharopolyspora taberi]|uniref:Class I SAM-dependent methyltransferase n=1 Tax=Saccharopolyspora taberi TaxID=60895 RepID=A0ABN3VFN0_9PSEU